MREPISGHEVVKKKRDCNNLEKETAGLEKVKVIARFIQIFRLNSGFQDRVGFPMRLDLLYLSRSFASRTL